MIWNGLFHSLLENRLSMRFVIFAHVWLLLFFFSTLFWLKWHFILQWLTCSTSFGRVITVHYSFPVRQLVCDIISLRSEFLDHYHFPELSFSRTANQNCANSLVTMDFPEWAPNYCRAITVIIYHKQTHLFSNTQTYIWI